MITTAAAVGFVRQWWTEMLAAGTTLAFLFICEGTGILSAGRISAIAGGIGVVLLTIPALYLDYYGRLLSRLNSLRSSGRVVNLDGLIQEAAQVPSKKMAQWSKLPAWALRMGLILSAASYLFAYRAAT